jgi:hypothetical protein
MAPGLLEELLSSRSIHQLAPGRCAIQHQPGEPSFVLAFGQALAREPVGSIDRRLAQDAPGHDLIDQSEAERG